MKDKLKESFLRGSTFSGRIKQTSTTPALAVFPVSTKFREDTYVSFINKVKLALKQNFMQVVSCHISIKNYNRRL